MYGLFTIPGKPSALFFKAIVAGFRGKVALKIGHLAFQVQTIDETWPFFHGENGKIKYFPNMEAPSGYV